MENKTFLVTGASSGIGRTVAIYLAEQGANVVLTARREADLKALVDEIGNQACYYCCDLQKPESIGELFQFCESQKIIFNGMVYSAGIANPVPIRSSDVEETQKIMQVNAISFMEIAKYFYKKKFSQIGSSIVAISSLAATRPVGGQGAYAASKAALNTMVQVMAQEFLKRKIRVNSIMPSYVDTPMVNEGSSFGMNNGIENMPLGVIEPLQIAYLVEFLLSDKALHITGAEIPVSSGV